MSRKEMDWVVELRRVEEKEQCLKDVSRKLGVSYRQVKRKWKRFRREGERGLLHRSRGRRSNRAKPEEMRVWVRTKYRECLEGWGPTLAAEKMAEWGVPVDHETLRRWLLEDGLWKRVRKRPVHRQRRERKEHFGELVQLDGSPHDWFGTGQRCCLMNLVDDATGRSLAQFFPEESTQAALRVLGMWIERYGIPQALYTDRHTIYVTDREEATREEAEAGMPPLTAFGKACYRLGIRIIAAHSPQAKGRVERKHGMYQDRLVKELKLRGIRTREEANAFLLAGYLDDVNRRFEKVPASPVDYHRSLPVGEDAGSLLTLEESRKVANDWTVRYHNHLYQISRENKVLPPAKGAVTVQERLDGSVHLFYRGREVAFREIACRPAPTLPVKPPTKAKKKWIPPADHPWRKAFLGPPSPKDAPPGGTATPLAYGRCRPVEKPSAFPQGLENRAGGSASPRFPTPPTGPTTSLSISKPKKGTFLTSQPRGHF